MAAMSAALPGADHEDRLFGDNAPFLTLGTTPFNMPLGNLSLVGLRPHAVLAASHNRTYADVVAGYFARRRVKSGITGWPQINGWRGEIDSDDKIKFRMAYDLHYIDNWSLCFDLNMLTPFRLLNTENAY
jgi:lipopolysaccharide/colanic/teichoic acid biosynthesis glycosyltransferase